jgi:glycine cleavage system H protein
VDVAVITGFATIETAVETMKYGAVDYVQKPFTEEELVEFSRKLLIKREARLEAQRRPTVRVVAPSTAETAAAHEFCVPGGAFVSDGHAWARIEPTGQVRIGLDDFARKALKVLREVEPPRLGETIQRGEPLFAVKHQDRKVVFAAPLSGRVVRINEALAVEPQRLIQSPYDRGWVCLIQPLDLAGELSTLRIGKPVVEWYQEEVARLREMGKALPEGKQAEDWDAFEKNFLKPRLARPA